jgi:hypothetical protein
MSASSEGERITNAYKEIAKGMADQIDANAGYPPLFDIFPKEGLIPYTQTYITLNYIGHAFLKPAYTANYHLKGTSFQAFVIDGMTPEGARKILSDYFQFTGQSQDFTEGNLLIQDRYNGNIPACWKGRYIVGAFNDNGGDFPEEIYIHLNQFK